MIKPDACFLILFQPWAAAITPQAARVLGKGCPAPSLILRTVHPRLLAVEKGRCTRWRMARWPVARRAPLPTPKPPALQGRLSLRQWSRAGQPTPPPALGASRALRRRRFSHVLPRYLLTLLSKMISQVSVSWCTFWEGEAYIVLRLSMLYTKFSFINTCDATCGFTQGAVFIQGLKARPHLAGESFQKWSHEPERGNSSVLMAALFFCILTRFFWVMLSEVFHDDLSQF